MNAAQQPLPPAQPPSGGCAGGSGAIKSVERLMPVHKKQALTYVRLANLRLGLLVNFGAPLIKDGIERLVNRLPNS